MAQIKKSGLGRGLESVFTDNNISGQNTSPVTLRISQIQPRKNQPRKNFDEEALSELASSIAEHGIIQPIAVRATESGIYEIVAGERRWRAAKMVNLTEVPVIVLEADDKKMSELALIENIQRENLNPIELSKAYHALIEEYRMTQEELASTLGISRSAIANQLRLTELPECTRQALEDGSISTGHAKVLLSIKEKADEILHEIIDKDLSVRQTEELIRKITTPKKEKTSTVADPLAVDYTALIKNRATSRLGRRVEIVGRGKSRRVELYFENDDDLEDLLIQLCGKDFFD
jgi:ParB family chromosome partitioning protein